MESEGVDHVPLGRAAGKALIVGKFLMLGEAARVGSWTGTRSLLVHVAPTSPCSSSC